MFLVPCPLVDPVDLKGTPASFFFFFNSSNEKRPTQLLCVRWLEAYALRFRVFARLFADLFACAFKRDRMSAALYAYASVS